MADIYIPGSPENGMGGYVIPGQRRNLAPEYATSPKTVDFISDPEADQRHVLPVGIEALRQHRDNVRGLDSSVTEDVARQAHEAKVRQALENEAQ